MTQKAIQVLQRNPHGFFLMVEAGRIDHAHHHNNGKRALLEVGSLEDAVLTALSLTSASDTLTVVTADHSHVFTFGGENTPRGHPVAAGRLDHAHHYNMAERALGEVISLEESVSAALKMINIKNTLIVVTSDHSHTLTFGGMNNPRGHPVLGFDSEISDLDFKPYTTLLYGNGPGYAHSTPAGRQNLTGINPEDINFVQQAAVPRKYETHVT
ncbi:Alkaline phosphatase, tissue-nonspecific isozyme [Armadillidium vulgare]|nr:Alkaline phosphatase, tissue-nonspecific isozyme [Armadillidium vulgare]